MANDPSRLLARLQKAAQRVSEAEGRAERERDRMYDIVREGLHAGVSLSAMARSMGVSRQAVQKMAQRLR